MSDRKRHKGIDERKMLVWEQNSISEISKEVKEGWLSTDVYQKDE